MRKVVPAAYDLIVGRTFVVMAEVWVDKRCRRDWSTSASTSMGRVGCSTCALGRLDVGKLDTLGLECGPVEAVSLPVGDVATLRVRTLHERRLTLALGRGCACDIERQSQNGQGNGLEERSHGLKGC